MTVRIAAAAALLLLVTACAGSRDHVIAFDQGAHSSHVRGLRIDVVEARYAERQLTVRCTLQNSGSHPVTIRRDGVLLEDDGLEIPSSSLAGQPTSVVVDPGDAALLLFTFAVGGHESRTRTLGLWSLEGPDGPLPPIRVTVPGIRTEPA